MTRFIKLTDSKGETWVNADKVERFTRPNATGVYVLHRKDNLPMELRAPPQAMQLVPNHSGVYAVCGVWTDEGPFFVRVPVIAWRVNALSDAEDAQPVFIEAWPNDAYFLVDPVHGRWWVDGPGGAYYETEDEAREDLGEQLRGEAVEKRRQREAQASA